MSKNRIAVNEVSSLKEAKAIPDYAISLILQLIQRGMEVPEREYKFAPYRKYAADLAYPEYRLLIEIEGGIYSGGRHTRGNGYREDCKKYNLAALEGFTVLRFTPDMIQIGDRMVYEAANTIIEFINRVTEKTITNGITKGIRKIRDEEATVQVHSP